MDRRRGATDFNARTPPLFRPVESGAIQDLAGVSPTDAHPWARSRQEHGVASVGTVELSANLDIEFALDDVDPFVLIVMKVARAGPAGGELEYAHPAVGVFRGHLARIGLAADLDRFAEIDPARPPL